MSGKNTIRMIEAYNQTASPTKFFSGMFQSPAQNFHSSEEVEIDIVRDDEDISIVIEDLSTGSRFNADDIYTNKKFKPPIHKEAIALNAHDLIKRMPGEHPFKDPVFRANVIGRAFSGMSKIERKIRRAVELQASQVLQTAQVQLADQTGTVLYELDYVPKATHFPTAGTAWDQVGADPLGDINALGEIIRNDGLQDPDQIIMGVDAFRAFVADPTVLSLYDNRRIDLGAVVPMEMRNNGGNYRGWVEVGNYRYDIWTYGGRYKDPQTGNKILYMTPNKVIVRASTGRMDATFGAIPNIGALLNAGSTRLIPELPGRIGNVAGGMDLHVNVWLQPDGEQLFAGVGARPLMIPTAIDTYGCLDTGL